MTLPDLSILEVGAEVATRTVQLTRQDLVRYAGASGDLNPIHWNERFATEVGLPGVIAHGMLTMGVAVDVVTAWVGDPAAIVDYGVRFTRPVPVPDPGSAELVVTGVVGAIDAEARTVRVDLTVTHDGTRVLGRAQAVVRV